MSENRLGINKWSVGDPIPRNSGLFQRNDVISSETSVNDNVFTLDLSIR